jgi:uncharacterized protein
MFWSIMKKLIIDGHNLIPKIPGLHLKDLDDELRLIEIIQEYCRLARKSAELFFDGSPTPNPGTRRNGLVHVHFVKLGYSADNAIIDWLRANDRKAADLAVVSSDRRIQSEAHALGVKGISSEEFSIEIRQVFNSPARSQEIKEKPLTSGEVDEWLDFFNSSEEN